ncbi:aromatic ring-hydroxylating dioxygenase subunit alpha [Nitrosomonas sp. HPC101]|uniref:aromatic ring-hydroxylating oxygenase subunit alpha n=1 Tax=Nitrosomonas sp. HPC101 TaxID=1658667 RepID=UPI00136E5780|nr:aromatic ring-hydroxylating dioxygenase subunit alpha [Nitrosomonas sp. HPC101]MXS86528.1 aromatic ring-hydroxylating dioxygenase subunit alpha [Nitrosomonas sp. HPC101]
MSGFVHTSDIAVAHPQLSVDWYLDPRIFELEKQLLFDRGPGYAGHELMVPKTGDYYVLTAQNNAKVLVRNKEGIELLSNICRHRQAVILDGRGNSRNIVCPIHRWTYAMDGKLLGAPHFSKNPCLNLGKTTLQHWNGLIFAGKRDVNQDLVGLRVRGELDFAGYMLDRVHVGHYQCNWKTFIEVYLEDYHVDLFHPGLGHFVDTSQLEWEFGDWYSVQTVGVNLDFNRAGSEIYQKWHAQVLQHNNQQVPRHGAIWLLYYPNVMIEWYPNTLVVSTILPTGIEQCMNVVEFYYPEEIVLFEREFVEREQAAYQETAGEDDEICRRITTGRRALYQQGVNETGPYQMPMEAGMEHFHRFLRREIEQYLP